MFGFNVLLKTDGLIIESWSIQTTNETGILQDQFLLLFLASQIGKSVNDYTEYQIQYNNYHNEEEE